jgi:hypothetical protein
MDINELLKKIWSNIFLVPEKRFDELTKDKEYKESFVYLLVCLAISSPILFISTILMNVGSTAALTNTMVIIILSIPFAYIGFGLIHLFLKLLGGKADFLKTVQVCVYGQTTATIFGRLPWIGWIFGLVALANVVLGAKRIHDISLLRAIVAVVIIPVILTMILAFLAAAYLISNQTFTGPVY